MGGGAVLLLTVELKRITGLGGTATLDGRPHWASSHLCPSSPPETSHCSLSLPQAWGFKYHQCADDPCILISSLDLSLELQTLASCQSPSPIREYLSKQQRRRRK